MATTICYDRLKVMIAGQPYLQNGWIVNVTVTTRFNSQQAQGMSLDGKSTGVTEGNESTEVSWTEIFPNAANYVDIKSLLRNNPAIQAGQVILQPTTIGGVPNAPAIVLTNFTLSECSRAAPGEGQTVTRSVKIIGDSEDLGG